MAFSRALIPGWAYASSGGQPELYFAYGSNMAIEQMAKRCPTSVLVGMARLHGFRWQINQRGVANIVRDADADADAAAASEAMPPHARGNDPPDAPDLPYVEGLVYRVTPADVQSLDRSEGVQHQLYQKHYLALDVQDIAGYTGHMCTQLVPKLAQALRDSPGAAGRPASPNNAMAKARLQAIAAQVLVYISDNFTQEGVIRDEYIERMNTAIQCGIALGISPDYVSKAIEPYLLDDDTRATMKTGAAPPRQETAGRDATVPKDDGDAMHVDGSAPQVSASATESASHVQTRQKQANGRAQATTATTATTAMCGNPECSHGSPLCELRTENRKPHSLSGTRFHGAIFDRLRQAQNGPVHGSGGVGDATDKKTAPVRLRPNVQLVFTVVMEEPAMAASGDHATGRPETARRSSQYSVEATTKTMAAAAELALKYFRDSLARFVVPVPGGVIGPPVPEELLLHQEPGAEDKVGECICVMGDSSLHLSVQLPQNRGGGSIKTWTTQTELYDWE